MKPSVCIIGAGIGGLIAGAYLIKAGYDVTIFEKAQNVGGSAGNYSRKNRIFPTGATIAFGLEEGGVLKEILQELDIDFQAELLHHPMDIILPDRTVSVYTDQEKWEKELSEKFPERSNEIITFWRKLTVIGDTVLAITKTKPALPVSKLIDVGGLPIFVLKHPFAMLKLTKYLNWTVED